AECGERDDQAPGGVPPTPNLARKLAQLEPPHDQHAGARPAAGGALGEGRPPVRGEGHWTSWVAGQRPGGSGSPVSWKKSDSSGVTSSSRPRTATPSRPRCRTYSSR